MKAFPFFQAILIVGMFCLISYRNQAQDVTGSTDTLRNTALRVYIDCPFCDMDFIREGITFVNYVRDRKEAQVHLLITLQETGSGGGEATLYFIGQKEFAGMNDTLIYNAGPNDTEDEIRSGGNQVIKLGLMRYVAKTPLGKYIGIEYEQPASPTAVDDPWNNWVFEVDLGGYFTGQESIRTLNIWSSAEAWRITPEWKIELGSWLYYNEDRFKVDEEEIFGLNRGKSFEALAVKSLGEHWSLGGNLTISSSLYDNYKLQYDIAPAIEYNLFPYSQSTRKQLRFLYDVAYNYKYYNDTTIYDKTEEGLLDESLSIALEIKQTWGSVNSSMKARHYFHDLSLYSLNLQASVDLRIVKGLSFRISGSVKLIHDQISLPKEGATKEEILLQKRQLATQYSYWGNAGITYTFGSIYNNVVNPRFGN